MNAPRALWLLIGALLATAPASADELAFETELLRHDAGTFYVRGRLGADVETELLLDTGSSYVALTRATFRKLAIGAEAEYLRHIEGAMASGRRLRAPVYRLATLAIGERCVLRDVEIAVLPNASRDILGLSALRQMQPIALSLDPPSLRFARCAAPLINVVANAADKPEHASTIVKRERTQ